ncbi:TM2 domain-containing protein [Mycobacterium fragae]|uniref:TM2 domain-containing protein n=1 Tax=Mycobacterium fragae TaxID=1260918 RepID=UPI000A157795
MPQQPEGFQNPSGPPQGSYPPPPGGYPAAPAPYPQMPYGPPGAPYAPYGYGVDAYGRPLSDKSKLTAGLLEIFLGSFGVGRFYLGYTGIGVAQIAATWLTCGIGGIWPLIDGIMMLTGKVPDAEGRILRE